MSLIRSTSRPRSSVIVVGHLDAGRCVRRASMKRSVARRPIGRSSSSQRHAALGRPVRCGRGAESRVGPGPASPRCRRSLCSCVDGRRRPSGYNSMLAGLRARPGRPEVSGNSDGRRCPSAGEALDLAHVRGLDPAGDDVDLVVRLCRSVSAKYSTIALTMLAKPVTWEPDVAGRIAVDDVFALRDLALVTGLAMICGMSSPMVSDRQVVCTAITSGL